MFNLRCFKTKHNKTKTLKYQRNGSEFIFADLINKKNNLAIALIYTFLTTREMQHLYIHAFL